MASAVKILTIWRITRAFSILLLSLEIKISIFTIVRNGYFDNHFQYISQLYKVLGGGWLPAGTATREEALQRVFKSLPEVTVEVGVDEWVQRRVEVADPEKNSNNHIGRWACLAAQRRDDVPQEKWQPAQHESAHDDA